MKIRIEVTQEHIDNGKACDANNCPVAEAVNEHLAEGYRANVLPTVCLIYFKKDVRDSHNGQSGFPHSFALNQEVRHFIERFDRKKLDPNITVEPFEFTVEIEDSLLKSVPAAGA